jgi:Fe-S oxidoreductase
MTKLFAPGCALMIYKPQLARRLHDILTGHFGFVDTLLTCCRHVPPLPSGAEVINVCPGCDRRYRGNYEDASTVSLWEVIAEHNLLSLPDYGRREMSIIDACPTRDQTSVHDAVRELARRMNIELVEPSATKTKSTCCGDSLWGNAPVGQVVNQMKRKAATMPVEDIIVYCVSCAKAMFVGGKRPRYLIDLLFEEDTVPQTYEPGAWHAQLDGFIGSHK